MTLRYTTSAHTLPESKMRMYPTRVINVIGGPGCDKSLVSAALVLYLNQRGKTVELIPDNAKALVWQKDFEALKNQYHIAQQQFGMLELLDGQVQFLVTEGSLPQLLYYNETYDENICDVAKTRRQILAWYRQHDNVNLLVERSERKYIQTGRFQDQSQALQMDRAIRGVLAREHLPFTSVAAEVEAVNAFAATLLPA